MKRLELKYQTSRTQAETMFKTLIQFCEIDVNAQNNVKYENISIYYDDKSLASYRQKNEGDNIRSKIRLRMSRVSGKEKILRSQIEIKERRGMDILKKNYPIDINDYSHALSDLSGLLLKDYNIFINNFFFPVVGVRYLRTALNSKYIPGLRVTFDTDIKSFYDFKNINNKNAQPLIIPITDCIIEIKLDRVMPSIIANLISKFNLQRSTFSKYSKSLENNFEFYNSIKTNQ